MLENPNGDRVPYWTIKGFRSNPFEFWNADQEKLLESYFVEPPYFSSVVGDPLEPSPAAVFAPRGGGKTAQRIMVERSHLPDVVVITYADFPPDPTGNYGLEYHLINVIRNVLP